jgi:Tfp pilus assembly protein FimT
MVNFQTNFKTNIGFGLVELLVSITIITIVTGIVLARHSNFNSAILLRNQAYEIAFHIREAQQLAVAGTSEVDQTGPQVFGVYFDSDNPGEYTLFKDSGDNPNGLRVSGGDEDLITHRLDSRFEISSITASPLHITFERPLYNATFRSSGSVASPVTITIGEISSGKTRSIIVTSAGQVTVQ